MSNENEHLIVNEKDLQHFIADYPWLLNLDYERVVSLKDGGIEYQIGDQKRIDLILRDRRSSSPVIVEFKFTPFYRENVGQILEYKARFATAFKREDSVIYSIFGENILTPKLALVVKTCDDFTRIACNMAGIDIYEYRNFSEEVKVPGKIETLQSLAASRKDEPIPLSLDRANKLEEEVYRPIKQILEEHNLRDAFREPRESNAYFFKQLAGLFLNRWLFFDETVSMGLTEDVFNTHDVIISYYSRNRNDLERFAHFYKQNYDNQSQIQWSDQWAEGCLDRIFPRKEFFAEVKVKFKEELKRYLRTRELLTSELNAGAASADGASQS